ncbi:hypothetical protein BDV93DRAFT_518147 [Ceratobasidium sp. AG-I]|nr:hypothetical protein BDV93DRAFT_518147 [Ceratobasidium sp. AG-I]
MQRRALPSIQLSLRHFVLRTETLSAYRQVIRTCRALPDQDARRETLSWFRHDFERLRGVPDPDVIQERLSGIRRSLKAMSPMFSLPTASV